MAYDTTLHQSLELRQRGMEPEVADQPLCLTRDNLSSKYFPKTGRSVVAAIAVLCLAFVLTSMNRINHTDSWGHLSFGRWIVQHGTLPQADPFAAAPRDPANMVNLYWLGQVTGYFTWLNLGEEGLVLLHALLATAGCGILLIAIKSRGVALGWAVMGAATMYIMALPVTGTFRPQLIGMVGVPLTLLAGAQLPGRRLVLLWLPVVYALWANMHGSFAIGLAMLGLYGAGEVWECWREKKSLSAALAEKGSRTWALALVLAIVASCLNPAGPKLLLAVASFGGNESLENISEWRPLVLKSFTGVLYFSSLVIGALLLRKSPRRITAGEVMLALFFGVLTLTSIRMITWWAMLFPFLAAPHAAAAWDKLRTSWGLETAPSPEMQEASTTSMNTLIAMACVFIAIVLAPPSHNLLLGQPRGIGEVTMSDTPVHVADEIASRHLAGNFFAPMDWSDFIIWTAGDQLKPLAYTHVHLASQEAWNDYLALAQGNEWLRLARKYQLKYLVVSVERQPALYRKLLIADRSDSSPAVILYRDEKSILVKLNPPVDAA